MTSQFERFNSLLRAFLIDLSDVFPENDEIRRAADSFDYLVRANYKKPHQVFTKITGPFLEQIAVRDESVFQNLELCGIHLGALLNDDTVTNNTMHAIWEYVSQLVHIAYEC